MTAIFFGNSLDKRHHTRSVAYSVELFLLNKHQISGGGAYPDCYQSALFCLKKHQNEKSRTQVNEIVV